MAVNTNLAKVHVDSNCNGRYFIETNVYYDSWDICKLWSEQDPRFRLQHIVVVCGKEMLQLKTTVFSYAKRLCTLLTVLITHVRQNICSIGSP